MGWVSEQRGGKPPRASTGHATRTHKAPQGFYAPMPPPRNGEVNRVLQGGLAPVAFRTASAWSSANKGSPEPYASKAIKAEVRSGAQYR